MISYLLKRIWQAIPIMIGVNILTFTLFFFVNSPDEIARVHLGNKYVTQEAIDNWKETHDYNLPLFYNAEKQGIDSVTKTLFFQKSVRLFIFDFGVSDAGRDIQQAIQVRYLPSLLLAVPSFVIGLAVSITVALLMVFFRGTYLDIGGVLLAVMLMSISALFYIVAGQFVIAKVLRWVPISGYVDGFNCFKFLVLPILISSIASLGAESRWYRTLFLEEIEKEYVRTGRAKGLSEIKVLFSHVLRNALIPILTGVVAVLPLLFMGSLLMESFFAIPGLGSYTVDAIREQDFAIVRVMVFLGTGLYIIGLLLTDLSYVWVDPRIRLK